MNVQLRDAGPTDLREDSGNVAVLVDESKELRGSAKAADEASGGAIGRLLEGADFHAKPADCAVLRYPTGLSARSLVVVGTGKLGADASSARKCGAAAAASFGKRGGTIFADGAFSGDDQATLLAELALGAGLRTYRFENYRTPQGREPDDPDELEAGPIMVAVEETAPVEAAFSPRAAVLAGTCLTRDLVNEPANVLGTTEFAERLDSLAEHGLSVEVLGERELEELGMRTLLAVGQGSARESHVVVMQWRGAADANAPPFVLVGKGVVFDTGGISIKPAKGMQEMTMDMGGAGVVAGAMKALALRKARANVVGLVGLVENMPSGRALRPGDIVVSMSGKTVEVINTDAEGRLVLADLLWYAQERFSPSGMVNLATLTGAMMVALGKVNAGYFSNDEDLAEGLRAAAETESEGLWRMPLGKEYAKTLKSRIADLKNVSDGPWGGAITAAEFLQAFVRKDTPWAHIDIAGVTLSSSNLPLSPRGATGWGVRTLDRLIADFCEAK